MMVHYLLRPLALKDAPLMLEWMHSQDIVKHLQADFREKTLADCEAFILSSHTDKNNLHLAIVTETDEYMGTISLKNMVANTAEFAICMRQSAMGTGLASAAMDRILTKGFDEVGLESIYWYVSTENKRAIRFYDKNGYKRTNFRQIIIGGGEACKQPICLVSGDKIQTSGMTLRSLQNIINIVLVHCFLFLLFKCCSQVTLQKWKDT